MKYIIQFTRILMVCLIGEMLSNLLPFPIPASIYGLVLLFLALKFGIYRLDQVRETGKFFVSILTIFFVPAAVGIMEQWEELTSMIVPCIIATIPITLLVMGVCGSFTQWIHRVAQERHEKRGKDNG